MIYFRGCTAREKETAIQDATEKLLRLAGIDYHILNDEKCCGSVLLRTGFIRQAQEQIQKNTEILKDELILTSCAGCYKTLKDDYEGLDVIHISQFLKQLIDDDKLSFTKKDLKVTYHDSCHLGRHSNIFDEPRDVISAVADLVEMENIRENSICCGAGGGVKSAYPEIASQMAESRVNQAKETGAELLLTPCPFCKLNLKNDDLEVMDLTEFLVKYGGVYEDE
ncbi:MAG: (Fe-S)-binding protein [Methanobrevibacter sp.]|uniref:(Fe-S)-binding protein n=1 Tax=Methanobrevibacter sp. TaxID=66852 RepID=UPI0025DF80FC|nr:heterodisulfide reductase-related iron-sulfur binding cluster [Methanobrevibacter sp.]MBR0271976.1 (Fe-S)-binding protein [Methanobrevibacter sp.]